MILRDYQQRSIDLLYNWLRNNQGNPCLVLPTGSGKSHIVAELCNQLSVLSDQILDLRLLFFDLLLLFTLMLIRVCVFASDVGCGGTLLMTQLVFVVVHVHV